MPIGGREAPPISKGTLKRMRVELCLFGVVGLEVARDAYWESLGNDTPRAGNTPSFGSYPEWETRRRKGKPSLAEEMGRLPFDRHVRSCASAKHLKEPPYAKLDPELATFDKLISELNRTVSDAARYYARNEWSRDGFKKGHEYHQSLSDTFSGLDAAAATYAKAVDAWRDTLGPIEEELDQGGKISARAADAGVRLASRLLDPPPRNADAIDKYGAELTTAAGELAAHGKSQPDAHHPKIVGPKLDALSAMVGKVAVMKGKLGSRLRWEVAEAAIDVIEANHRALVQHMRGDDPDDPMGALPSRLFDHDRARPKASVVPRTPRKPSPPRPKK